MTNATHAEKLEFTIEALEAMIAKSGPTKLLLSFLEEAKAGTLVAPKRMI